MNDTTDNETLKKQLAQLIETVRKEIKTCDNSLQKARDLADNYVALVRQTIKEEPAIKRDHTGVIKTIKVALGLTMFKKYDFVKDGEFDYLYGLDFKDEYLEMYNRAQANFEKLKEHLEYLQGLMR